jgi:hypothetical protein
MENSRSNTFDRVLTRQQFLRGVGTLTAATLALGAGLSPSPLAAQESGQSPEGMTADTFSSELQQILRSIYGDNTAQIFRTENLQALEDLYDEDKDQFLRAMLKTAEFITKLRPSAPQAFRRFHGEGLKMAVEKYTAVELPQYTLKEDDIGTHVLTIPHFQACDGEYFIS